MAPHPTFYPYPYPYPNPEQVTPVYEVAPHPDFNFKAGDTLTLARTRTRTRSLTQTLTQTLTLT